MEDVCYDGVFERMLGLSKGRMEVYLSHVCHRWREVATSTAVLWTDIDAPKTPGGQGAARAEAYLLRSKARLVDVSMVVTVDDYSGPRTNWGQGFLQVAAKHSTRWRSLVLQFPAAYTSDRDWDAAVLCNILRDVAVPQLERLELTIDSGSSAEEYIDHQIFLQGTPRLSDLLLRANQSFWFILPMDSITTLTIYAYYAEFPIKRILSLPGLQHLNITRHKTPNFIPIELEEEDSVLERDSPSRLISLRLSLCDLPAICSLSATFRPALENVTHLFLFDPTNSGDAESCTWREGSDDEDEEGWDDWSSQLEGLEPQELAVFPSLEHLSVDFGLKHSSYFLENDTTLCRLTNNIKTLSILHGRLELDAENGSLEALWPRLEKLYLASISDELEKRDILVDWITKRGRQSDGTFTVEFGPKAVEKLKKGENLHNKVSGMKKAVRMEPVSKYGKIFDGWPPRSQDS